MFGLSNNHIDLINSVFTKYDCISKVVVYGSRAKGNYKKGSDIDLAIVGNERKFSYYLNEETNLPYFFDVVNLEKLDNSILEHIKRVGKDIIPNHKTITTPYIHSNSLQYNHNHKVV